jgi:hypothetical protein
VRLILDMPVFHDFFSSPDIKAAGEKSAWWLDLFSKKEMCKKQKKNLRIKNELDEYQSASDLYRYLYLDMILEYK